MSDQNNQQQGQMNVNVYRLQLQIQNLAQRNAELTAQISALEANMQIRDQIDKGEIKFEESPQSPLTEAKEEQVTDADAEDLGNLPTH